LNCLGAGQECDREMDGRTDGLTI